MVLLLRSRILVLEWERTQRGGHSTDASQLQKYFLNSSRPHFGSAADALTFNAEQVGTISFPKVQLAEAKHLH